MQSRVPERFEREMSCSESDWLRWLPEAIGEQGWTLQGHSVVIDLGYSHEDETGQGATAMPKLPAQPRPSLTLAWQPLPPLTIALLALPRLRVSFMFEGVAEAGRRQFMRRFDLYLQRGGG